MNDYKNIVYNVPIGERWFEIKLLHNQSSSHRIIFVDSKEVVNQEQHFFGRFFSVSTTDKFRLGRKRGDPEDMNVVEREVALRIEKDGDLFKYDFSIGGTPLIKYLAKCHRKTIVWELPSTGSSKTKVFLHLESSLLWWKGNEIGERQQDFRRDGPKKDLKINFEIERRIGNIEVQNMNDFLFYVLKFDGIVYPKLENWNEKIIDE